jgi:4-hydroxy-4-methyl-2-oxoglutarate aldolase
MSWFNEKYRDRFEKLSTTNISDALDALDKKGSTFGIRPLMPQWGRCVGPAVTVKITAAGETKGKNHLGIMAIESAKNGDVIIIDNGGRLDTSCWGGILANAAKLKGVSGVVIDGACRDLDDCIEADFPVYARGTVVATARGRIMEENTNVMISFGGVQVRPGDIVMCDRSGVVIVAKEHLDAVLEKAEMLWEKEEAMIADMKAGMSALEVDNKYNYEKMLK